MSLFKILRGDSSRIDTTQTPFHDGYCYFTPDNKGFYIDYDSGAEQKRLKINHRASSVLATLTAAGWLNKTQILSIAGLEETTNGNIGLAPIATAEEANAARRAAIRVTAQSNGQLTVVADGDTPSTNIPVVVTMYQ